MATVVSYARPSTLAEALDLLARPDAVALAGGTTLNAATTPEPVAVVDLQALGLDRIEERGDWTLRIGATSTLQQLADASCAPATVREAARRELPSTLRAAATVGGCIATAHPASELLAALLVHEAHVEIAGELVPLDSFLEHPPRGLITAVSLRSAGVSMVARTGRTRADRPIVAAAARRKPDGACLLALSGVASRPLLVHDLESLDPPGDFRGSRDYRRALASVLARRVLEAVE